MIGLLGERTRLVGKLLLMTNVMVVRRIGLVGKALLINNVLLVRRTRLIGKILLMTSALLVRRAGLVGEGLVITSALLGGRGLLIAGLLMNLTGVLVQAMILLRSDGRAGGGGDGGDMARSNKHRQGVIDTSTSPERRGNDRIPREKQQISILKV